MRLQAQRRTQDQLLRTRLCCGAEGNRGLVHVRPVLCMCVAAVWCTGVNSKGLAAARKTKVGNATTTPTATATATPTPPPAYIRRGAGPASGVSAAVSFVVVVVIGNC